MTTQEKDSPQEETIRQRIISKAREEFFTHGFRNVTMDEIAGMLGMSKKTLYKYFENKNALVTAVLLEKSKCIEADIQKTLAECPSDILALLHLPVSCIQRHMEEIKPPFMKDMSKESPELFRIVEIRRREILNTHLKRIIENAMAQGQIRSDIPSHIIMEILLAIEDAILNPHRLEELSLEPKVALSYIFKVFLEGIVIRQPLKDKKSSPV